MLAARYNHQECVELLMSKCANVNLVNNVSKISFLFCQLYLLMCA